MSSSMGLNGMNTYRQDDLLAELVKMFPQFRAVWEEENGDEEFRSSSLHSVYMSFLPFVAVAQPTQKQWQLLADHRRWRICRTVVLGSVTAPFIWCNEASRSFRQAIWRSAFVSQWL